MFALLGDIRIGVSPLTGPTADEEARQADYSEHAVARGKPVLQDHGDALDTRTLDFFFDESFCDVGEELGRLEQAIATRVPMALVLGDGSRPTDYVVRRLRLARRNTTPGGSLTRLEATVALVEAPASIAAVSGPGLLDAPLLNPLTQR